MRLAEIGELPLIELIRRRFGQRSKGVIAGIGDDAAVIESNDNNLLITTDMMLEGIHFDLSFTTPYHIGYKLVSINVSDIFAMGGIPKYLLLNIALNKNIDKSFVDGFFDGVHDAAKLYRVSLIGGDMSSSKKGIAVAASLIGYSKKQIMRSGAKPGDKIYVTGNLGDSACGLEILKTAVSPKPSAISKGLKAESYPLTAKYKQKGLTWNIISPLIQRHLMPVARNPKSFAGYATAMIDISDGLFIDLTRLCNESKVGAKIYAEQIPISPQMKKASSIVGMDSLKLAASGGEDYELLFTAHSYPPAGGVKITCIGEITKKDRVVIDEKGRETKLKTEGYQHFGLKR